MRISPESTVPSWVDELFGAIDDQEWQASALCAQVGGDLWFPERGGDFLEAKRICQQCPVRVECLEYALAHDERFGLWGGLSERGRREIKKQRQREAS